MNTSNKPLARLIYKKRKKEHFAIPGMKEGVITTDVVNNTRTIKECFIQLYKHRFDNSDVLNPLLDNTSYQNSLE